MAETDSSVAVTEKVHGLLSFRKAELGIAEVYYGDQTLIPVFPAVVLESYPKDRTIRVTHKFDLTIRVGITIYHDKVQSTTVTKKEAEELAEAVEAVLQEDMTMGGLVLFGFVTRVEPGVAIRQREMIRASRLTWEGRSKVKF